MKHSLLIIILFLHASKILGQNISTDLNPEKSIMFQTDSFDFMAKGFSIWASFQTNQNRFFLASGKNSLPDFLNKQSEDFSERRKFFVQMGYYRYIKKSTGLFVGVESIFQNMEIIAKKTSEMKESPVLRVAPVVGYEWLPLKKSLPQFSITPWISERFPLYSKSVEFANSAGSYQTANFNFVMGLNLGYRISLKK